MNKIKVMIGIALLAGLANANIVTNGSFEDATTGTVYTGTDLPNSNDAVTGWRIYDAAKTASYEVVNDATEATDGNNYLKIVSLTTSGDAGLDTAVPAGLVPMTLEQEYTFTFDAKLASAAGADNLRVRAISKTSAGSNIEILDTVDFNLTSSWDSYGFNFTPTAGTDPNLYLFFKTRDNSGFLEETVYIDNVQVQAVPEPATFGLVALAGGTLMLIRRRFRA